MDLRILEIASNTENNKVLSNHTHKSKNKNPICGDEMEISLIIKNMDRYQSLSVIVVTQITIVFLFEIVPPAS